MVEAVLLAKVTMVIKGFLWTSYGVVGTYLGGVAVTYVKDYRESVEKEKMDNA